MVPIHDISLTCDELARLTAGELVETVTDKHLTVLLILTEHYDRTPARNCAELLPINPNMLAEITSGERTGLATRASQHLFSIAVTG